MIKVFSAFSGSSKYSIKEYMWKGNDVKFKKSNPPTSLVNLPNLLTTFNDDLSVCHGCIYDIVTLWLNTH